MRFGVWIPNCRHLATADIIRTTAVRAEQLGYDSVWRLCQARGRAAVPALTLRNDVRILRPGQSAPASAHAGRVLAGEPAALVDQLGELRDCGIEHLVCEFLAGDGRDLDEQMAAFAERVRPALA